MLQSKETVQIKNQIQIYSREKERQKEGRKMMQAPEKTKTIGEAC